MGVDVEYVIMVGIKTDYNSFGIYKSKNDCNFAFDEEHCYIKDYKQILFKDNLPEKYDVYNDGMGGDYCYIGKVITSVKEYMDEIGDYSFTPEELQQQIDRVFLDLEGSQIKINKEDIKLHIFVHFS